MVAHVVEGIVDVENWCGVSLAAVRSLWDSRRGRAWRNSVEKGEHSKARRPTVTFNALTTFSEYGLASAAPGAD